MADKLPTFDLSGQNVAELGLAGVVGSPAANAAAEGWDKFIQIVGSDFTEAEYLFDDLAGSLLDAETVTGFVEVGAGLTADIASLEPVGFAAALLLSEYAFGWVVTKVAAVFPNPSIFGWRPLNFIQAGIDNFGKQFEQSASGLGSMLAHVFIQPFRQILGLFQRSGNATASAHRKISHVVRHTIPDTINAALNDPSVLGPPVAAVVDAPARAAFARLVANPTEADAQQLIAEAQRIGGFGWDLIGLAASAIVATDEYANSLHRDSATAITSAVTKAQADQTKALDALQTELVKRLAVDESTLSSVSAAVTTTLPASVAKQVAQAEQLAATNTAKATAELQQQINALVQQMTTLANRITADEQVIAQAQVDIAAEQTKQTADEQAIAAAQQVITTAQADIATSTTAISTLHQQIIATGSQLSQVQQTQQLHTSQVSQLGEVTSVLIPTALATLATTLNQVKTKVDTCVVTTCDPSSPQNLRNQLLNLLQLMSAAGELTFIAEAIKDPIGTAGSVSPLLEGLDSSAVGLLDALLSF